jgi:hypothetical protein
MSPLSRSYALAIPPLARRHAGRARRRDRWTRRPPARVGDEGRAHRGRLGGEEHDIATSVWHVLASDQMADHDRRLPPRCPAVAICPYPGDRGFLDGLRRAVDGYMRTVITGSSASKIEELCKLLDVRDAALEECRPFNGPFGADSYDSHASELLEPSLSRLTLRRPTSADICYGVSLYASAWELIVWMCRVALTAEPPPPVSLAGVADAMQAGHEAREERKARMEQAAREARRAGKERAP